MGRTELTAVAQQVAGVRITQFNSQRVAGRVNLLKFRQRFTHEGLKATGRAARKKLRSTTPLKTIRFAKRIKDTSLIVR